MRIRQIVMAALALLFLFSAGMVARELIRTRQEKQANRSLAEQVHHMDASAAEPKTAPKADLRLPTATSNSTVENGPPTSASNVEASDADPEIITMLPQYAWLWELNPDFAGWLSIDGTEIDYPVVYTPEDQDYYLRRAFDGSDARSGTLFIAVPWQAGHTLIYGHNMKNNAMFGTLLDYADAEFAREHPVIRFDTLTAEGEYEVMAAFRSRAAKRSSEGVFPYWMYTDLSDAETFDTYVQEVKGLSLYDTGVEAAFGDELLTLSTCDYYTTQGRFVVVARKISE